MHYKDGTEAELWDVVRGKGYNLPYEIQGIVVGLTRPPRPRRYHWCFDPLSSEQNHANTNIHNGTLVGTAGVVREVFR